MPFNKSMLVIASVNLELARENAQRWSEWISSLRAIASQPTNVVAANNKYDAEYIRYFAGVEAVYVPSYCGYAALSAQYAPRVERPILLARNHHNPSSLYEELRAAAAQEARAATFGGELGQLGDGCR
uniref:Uncharacterized protein n=1 Tax=Calcidiscus leptoporus TaxID=127549 RepID=A0A7S0J696_9EUKA|mmetsp:Transcript_40366/g.94202  ORF Transcript_40366/g.94202 Transcript_40366/m.94202 type:complete len:128 (+) Transcript_40366:3-386(+)